MSLGSCDALQLRAHGCDEKWPLEIGYSDLNRRLPKAHLDAAAHDLTQDPRLTQAIAEASQVINSAMAPEKEKDQSEDASRLPRVSTRARPVDAWRPAESASKVQPQTTAGAPPSAEVLAAAKPAAGDGKRQTAEVPAAEQPMAPRQAPAAQPRTKATGPKHTDAQVCLCVFVCLGM